MGTNLFNKGILLQTMPMAMVNGELYRRLARVVFNRGRHKSQLSRLGSDNCAPWAQLSSSHLTHAEQD